MRQLCDRVQAKHCRQTLQRMGGAEDSIHQMRLALGAFGFLEQEQIAAQGVDNFGRFRDELVQSLGRHVTRLSNSAATALPAQDSKTHSLPAPSLPERSQNIYFWWGSLDPTSRVGRTLESTGIKGLPEMTATRFPRNCGTNWFSSAEARVDSSRERAPGTSRATPSILARLKTSAAFENSSPSSCASNIRVDPVPMAKIRGIESRPPEGSSRQSHAAPLNHPCWSTRESAPQSRQSTKPAAPWRGRSSSGTKRQSASSP